MTEDHEETVASGLDDACVALGVAVLDLFANGAENVLVCRDGKGGFVAEDIDSTLRREMRLRKRPRGL